MSVKPKFYTYAETAERLGMTAYQLRQFIAYPSGNPQLRAVIETHSSHYLATPTDPSNLPNWLAVPLEDGLGPSPWDFPDCLKDVYGFAQRLGSDRRTGFFVVYQLRGILQIASDSMVWNAREAASDDWHASGIGMHLVTDASHQFDLISDPFTTAMDAALSPSMDMREWLFIAEDVERLATGAEQATPGKWPWGDHETELLRELAAAAREWWSTYDPEQPDTAPKNEQIEQWLTGRNVSGRTAEVMATILRADGLPKGPRK